MCAGVAPTSPNNLVWQPRASSSLCCLACTTTHNLADTSSTTHCSLRKGNHSAHDNRLDPNFTAGSCHPAAHTPSAAHALQPRYVAHVPLRLSVPTPPCCRCYPTMWACLQVPTTRQPCSYARAQHVSTLATTHAFAREKGGITSTVHHIPHVPHVGLNTPMHAHNVSCLSNARSQRAATPCSLRTSPSVLVLTQHAPSRSCTLTPTRTTAASNITDDNQHQTSVGVSQTHGGRAVTPACKGGCQCRQVQRRKHATRRAH